MEIRCLPGRDQQSDGPGGDASPRKPEVHRDPQGGGSGSGGHLLIARGPLTLMRGDGEQVICRDGEARTAPGGVSRLSP